MSQTNDKQVHLNLHGEQVKDLEMLHKFTGIANDNDLFRFLLRQAVRALPSDVRAQLQEQVVL